VIEVIVRDEDEVQLDDLVEGARVLLDGLWIQGSIASVAPPGAFTTNAAWPYRVTSVLPLVV